MKKLVVLLLVVCAFNSHAQKSKNSPAEFIVHMADSRLACKDAGRYAASLGTSDEIRNYGNQLMKDEESLYAKITDLARSKGITLPNAISEKKAVALAELSKLTGKPFDRKFIKVMKENLKYDVRSFKKAAKSSDRATADFASRYLPMIERHLESVKRLKVKKK